MFKTQRKLLNAAGADLMSMQGEDKEIETIYCFFSGCWDLACNILVTLSTIFLFTFYP